MENYGLLRREELNPKDYIFGGVSGSQKAVLSEIGQYLDVLPVKELQHGTYVDSMACVSFSALNCIEILFKVKYGIEVNYSDRALAKMSETTRRGNYLDKVAETIRLQGVVPDELWAFDRSSKGLMDWDLYYREIPQIVLDTRFNFLKDYEIKWEWVYNDPREALKYGPLQVTICYQGSHQAVNGIIPKTNSPANHAVTLVGYKENEYWVIFDHYEMVVKKLAWDYTISDKLLFTLNKKVNTTPMISIPNNSLVQEVEQSGQFGFHLDNKIYIDSLDKITATFLQRNLGDIKGKVKALTKKDWDSFPKFNLKNEAI